MIRNDEFRELVQRYASKGILVDTNVLLVYFVGLVEPELVGQVKRTRSFNKDDFHIIRAFVGPFHRLITTPQILSELWSLSVGLRGREATYFDILRAELRRAQEEYTEKNVLLRNEFLPRIGFTDLSILEAARKLKCLVLTDDFAASVVIGSSGGSVVNFNHLRQSSWC